MLNNYMDEDERKNKNVGRQKEEWNGTNVSQKQPNSSKSFN